MHVRTREYMHACMRAYMCMDAWMQVMGDIYDRLAAMHSGGGGGGGPPHEVRLTSCLLMCLVL